MCIVVADPQHATNVCTFKRVVARWWGNKKISLSTVNNNKKKTERRYSSCDVGDEGEMLCVVGHWIPKIFLLIIFTM
jgi:hypothetical protein